MEIQKVIDELRYGDMESFRVGDAVVVATENGRVKGLFNRRTPKMLFLWGTRGEEIKVYTDDITDTFIVDREEIHKWGEIGGHFLFEILRVEIAEVLGDREIRSSISISMDKLGILVSSIRGKMRVANRMRFGKYWLSVYNYDALDKEWGSDGVRGLYSGKPMVYGAVKEFVSGIYIEVME